MRARNRVGAVRPYGVPAARSAPEAVWVGRAEFKAGSVMDSQSDLWGLVRRAVSLLERDSSEAWQCLRDAYTLLGQQSSGATVASRVARPVQAGSLAAWQTRRVLEHIEEHLGAKLTIEDIAAAIGLSKSHFSRAFKSTLGTSPMAYVAARRIERAKRMMVASTESLAEVAIDCGFADQSHLNRRFRRVVGVTPGQWRRSSASAPGTVDGGLQPREFLARQRTVVRQAAGVSAVS